MKIVVFGPDRRVGAMHDDSSVVDLSLAQAKLLRERDGERHASELASALVPADLSRFIERGDAALDAASQSIDYLFQRAHDRHGPHGETIVHPIEAVRLHAPRPQGARIACAGGNYADHHLAMARNRPGGSKEAADLTLQGVAESIRKSGFWGFWKVDRTCLGPDDEVSYPSAGKIFRL